MKSFTTKVLASAFFASLSALASAYPAGFEISPASVNSLSYEPASHSLVLDLSYTGCAKAQHQLSISDICNLSSPLQCGAAVLIPTDYDDSCATVQNEQLVYALGSRFANEPARLTVYNKSGPTLSTFIDKKDKTLDTLSGGFGDAGKITHPIGKLADTVITSARYERKGHLLVLNLEYEACEPVTHVLTIGKNCSFSDPMQCRGELRSLDAIDDSCGKVIHEVFTYRLSSFIDRALLTISTFDGTTTEVFIGRK